MGKLAKIFFILVIMCLVHHLCPAQQNMMQVTGTVMNAEDMRPLAGASIYLSNTTLGAISSDSGTFHLTDIPPGRYDMVVAYLGYKTNIISINEQSDLNEMKIKLHPGGRLLPEVVVSAGAHWKERYGVFIMSFIGRDKNAAQCKIINSKVLVFKYVDSNHFFSASANEPLIIENAALGYKIHYQLKSFIRQNNHTSYLGYSHFELMVPRNNKEEKRWESNRKLAYYGSQLHFIRSLLHRSLKVDGFIVKKLVKSDDSLAGHPVLYKWTGKEFKNEDTIVVSRSEWNKRSGFNILYPGPVPYDSMISRPSGSVYHQLAFTNSLYIIYTKRKGSLNFFWGYVPGKYRYVFPASILTMKVSRVSVDNNGNLEDPLAITAEGYWATQRIADMLPLDYSP